MHPCGKNKIKRRTIMGSPQENEMHPCGKKQKKRRTIWVAYKKTKCCLVVKTK